MIDVIADVLRREGSKFTDDPHDRGGPTRFGITVKALCEYRRAVGGFVPKTVDEIREAIKSLTKAEAERAMKG